MVDEKYKTTQLRKPFYNMSDGVYEMSDVAFRLGDVELVAIMREMRDSLSKLHDKLNEKYIWD